MKYKYCQTCGGAMSERIEYASDMLTIVSWLRYEYDGLNLLRIDERYDGESPAGLDENDPWRPLNVFIHGPGAIGQIVKCKWYNYYSDGQNPTSCCDSGKYYSFYDALGNVNGVLDQGGHYYRWEMDAFGNDLPAGNAFLDMDQAAPKEHLGSPVSPDAGRDSLVLARLLSQRHACFAEACHPPVLGQGLPLRL